jgi:hypothetical protein
MKLRIFVFCSFLLLYGLSFVQQDKHYQSVSPDLSFPFPANGQKAVLGYLRQLGAELRFIQTAVFLGDIRVIKLSDTHIERLSQSFNVMAELHSPFIDTYFLCQSTLPHLGAKEARTANMVLEKGMKALPNKFILPFFIGFNHFYYLDEKLEGANALYKASQIHGSPTWLGHLSSMLSAEGGDIYAGLLWLKAIRASENDEALKTKYDEEIAAFENAIKIQKAIWAYRNQNGKYPETLDVLLPDFMPALPDFKDTFLLEWEPPHLKLRRSARAPLKK